MSVTKKHRNSNTWDKGNSLFILSLIVILLGTLLLIIGYGIYQLSAKNISSDEAGLITISKIGHVYIIKDNSECFII